MTTGPVIVHSLQLAVGEVIGLKGHHGGGGGGGCTTPREETEKEREGGREGEIPGHSQKKDEQSALPLQKKTDKKQPRTPSHRGKHWRKEHSVTCIFGACGRELLLQLLHKSVQAQAGARQELLLWKVQQQSGDGFDPFAVVLAGQRENLLHFRAQTLQRCLAQGQQPHQQAQLVRNLGGGGFPKMWLNATQEIFAHKGGQSGAGDTACTSMNGTGLELMDSSMSPFTQVPTDAHKCPYFYTCECTDTHQTQGNRPSHTGMR